MKLYKCPIYDAMCVSKYGDVFYIHPDTTLTRINIDKHNTTFLTELVLSTFYGFLPNSMYLYMNGDTTDISLKNVCYELTIDDNLVINGMQFVTIPGFSNYAISVTGVVYGKLYRKLIVHKISQFEYHSIGITDDTGKRKFVNISRLLYMTYGDDYDTAKQVNHIDSRPWQNYLYNFNMMTSLENTRHSFAYGRRDNKWCADEIHQICKYIQDGKVPKEIYELMGLKSKITRPEFAVYVNHLLKKDKYWKDICDQYDFSNIKSFRDKYMKYTDEMMEDVVRMLGEGHTQKEIADIYGVDCRVIWELKERKKRQLLKGSESDES